MSRRMPKKYNDPKLSQSDILTIIAEVKRKGRVSAWDVAMIYGSTNGLFASGELVEKDGHIVLAQPQINELDRQIAEGKQSVDPAYRQHAQMLEDCTKGDWLDQAVAEVEQEQRPEIQQQAVAA